MKHKDYIKNIAFSSIMSALITTIILIGGFIDILDLLFACIASLVLHIIYNKTNNVKMVLLIYAVSSALSFILLPLRSCSLYYIFFFGYYPVLRAYMQKHIKSKSLVYCFLLAIYNTSMAVIFIMFSKIFGVENEPTIIYVVLFLTANVFYFSFELLISRIMLIVEYRIAKFRHERRYK